MTAAATVPADARRAIDWPTVGMGVGVYLGWGLVTWFYHDLSWWLVLPAGACLVCLHGSLQHEAVHGYPTRWTILNSSFVFPSLWLWLPYTYYRETHLIHHRDERLTSPLDDPESNYLTQEQWRAIGPLHRSIRQAMTTVFGRLVLGPPYFAWRALARLSRALRDGERPHLRHWGGHAFSVATVLVWVVGICDIPILEYVLLFAYPGLSLTLLRSFAEHRAAEPVNQRTAITESGPFFSLLFLNNNLHFLHHLEPGAPWHRRRREYRRRRAELLGANGGYLIRGYREVFARYLLRPKEPAIHPIIGL